MQNKKLRYFDGAFCLFRNNLINTKFGHCTGKKVKVCVIDSGWNKELKDTRIKEGISFIDSSLEFKLNISENYHDNIGHGTSITDLILQIAPDIQIIHAKVFEDKLETSIEILIESIKWAIDKKVNIINLSLGSEKKYHIKPLYKICEIAKEKNIIIVASNSNTQKYNYPAIFENSIGVGSYQTDIFNYYYMEDSAIECLAKGYNQYAMTKNGKRELLSGNSYATPVITGIIALLFEKHQISNIYQLRTLLKEYSKKKAVPKLRRLA